MKPFIDARKCPILEDMCTIVRACPREAVSFLPAEKDGEAAQIKIDYERCDGCGECARACCGSAVEMR